MNKKNVEKLFLGLKCPIVSFWLYSVDINSQKPEKFKGRDRDLHLLRGGILKNLVPYLNQPE